MWAVVLGEYGGVDKLHWKQVEDPRPGEGEVLVSLAATSVNPVDWKMRSGAAKERFPLEFPAILGRDVSGVVREVGPGAEGFVAGDRVMAMTQKTYAELVVVKAADLARVPDNLDLVEAGSLPLVTLTGEQLITRGAKLERGQTVLVTGALGSVGRAAVHVAKKLGATVIAGVREKQRTQAGELGAAEILELDSKSALAGLGFLDAIADTIGGSTSETLLGKVKQGGVFASVVAAPGNATLHPTVRVSRLMAQPDVKILEELAGDAAAKRLRIPIDRMVPLREAAAAQGAAEKGGIGGKVLLLA